MNWMNPKNWIIGALKRTAIGIVNAEADKLAQEIKDAIAKDGPGAIDRTIGASEGRIIAFIQTKGPTWAFLDPIRAQAAAAVKTFGDDLEVKLDAAIKDGGANAVDLIVAQAKALLLARLNAINA